MDIYLRTPGSTLMGPDKELFDEISGVVDGATHDMLIRPDWAANMRCVDLVSTIRHREVFADVVFLLRRKLRASEPKSVTMALKLLEALANNCGATWHEAMNDEKLMKDIAGVARKYVAKSGAENKEVADVCLDLVQGWGEAFLPKKKMFPNIVAAYFDLRKEGLPFRVTNQFDPSRVPIFGKPAAQGEYLDPQTDAMLAAAIQESLHINKPSVRQAPAPRVAHSAPSPPVMPVPVAPPALRAGMSGDQLLASLQVTLPLLKDLITTAKSESDVRDNDFANDIMEQSQECLTGMNTAIEASMDNPEVLEKLFSINDDAQTIVNAYRDLQRGSVGLAQAKSAVARTLCTFRGGASPSVPATQPHLVSSAPTARMGSPCGHAGSPVVGSSAYRGGSPAKSGAPTHQYQPQHAPPVSPVLRAAPPPPQQTETWGARPAPRVMIAPPPSNTSRQVPIPVLAPPPQAARPAELKQPGGLLQVDSCEEIVTVQAADPFAPEALDALFDNKKPVAKKPDPFSPEALDKLFDFDAQPPIAARAQGERTPTKPVTVSTAHDPFSPEALDALFASPPPSQPRPAPGPQHAQYPPVAQYGAPYGQQAHFPQPPPMSYHPQSGYPAQSTSVGPYGTPGGSYPSHGPPSGPYGAPSGTYPPYGAPGSQPGYMGYPPGVYASQQYPPGYGPHCGPGLSPPGPK